MEPRSYLSETSWKTILASARSGTHPPTCQHGSRGPSCRCGRAPHVCPRNIMTMIRMHTMHQEASSTRAALRQAQPSQGDGHSSRSLRASMVMIMVQAATRPHKPANR